MKPCRYCIGYSTIYKSKFCNTLNCIIFEWLLNIRYALIHMGIVLNTDAVQPADVGRDTGEDGGLPVSIAARGRHKAGHTMDNPLATDLAVQGATRVTLHSEKTHHRLTPELEIHN